MDQPTVPCRHCGKPTFMLGTKECDPCHELRIRVEMNPALARKFLNDMNIADLHKQLELVCANLRKGMGKSLQRWQADTIDEVLKENDK